MEDAQTEMPKAQRTTLQQARKKDIHTDTHTWSHSIHQPTTLALNRASAVGVSPLLLSTASYVLPTCMHVCVYVCVFVCVCVRVWYAKIRTGTGS